MRDCAFRQIRKDWNLNLLTENDMEGCDPAMGATNLRPLLCNVYDASQATLPHQNLATAPPPLS